jgi:hypothetical protein
LLGGKNMKKRKRKTGKCKKEEERGKVRGKFNFKG